MTLALIHSPLVGQLTWNSTAAALAQRGCPAVVPELRDDPSRALPFWQQHAESAAAALQVVPPGEALVLAGHSGAGALLPAIRQAIRHTVAGYVFVDAGIPVDGRSRLATFGEGEAADEFRRFLAGGGRFPTWTAGDLTEDVPDAAVAAALAADLRPRGLPFWDEPIPVFHGWPDGPCGYLLFSDSYRAEAARARAMGWPYRELAGGHFHMLTEPEAVADSLLELARPWLV
jgi:hypothetical protein